MRGKKQASKRKINPDPKYSNQVVAKFINYIMREGKKTIAQKIIYGALDIIGEREKKNPLKILEEAITNVAPLYEIKSRRIGGANYQIPVAVRTERRTVLALKWMIEAAKTKRGRSMKEKLAEELILASRGEGGAVKKKENVHKMAEANRAFAHFAW